MAAPVARSGELSGGPGFAARLRPALLRFFRRKTGDAAEAEDLTQDVLVRALTHAHWDTAEQAKGYIFRAAVNRLRDRRRRMQTHGVAVSWDDDQAPAGSQTSPERVLMAREALSDIDRALDDLDIRTRTVLVLIRLEHMKTAEVAQMLGISVRAVNKQLQKGLAHLAAACHGEDLGP